MIATQVMLPAWLTPNEFENRREGEAPAETRSSLVPIEDALRRVPFPPGSRFSFETA